MQLCVPQKKKLKHENKLPPFYRRYVDDTFVLVHESSVAASFLATLNEAHPAIMEIKKQITDYPSLESKFSRRHTISKPACTKIR